MLSRGVVAHRKWYFIHILLGELLEYVFVNGIEYFFIMILMLYLGGFTSLYVWKPRVIMGDLTPKVPRVFSVRNHSKMPLLLHSLDP